MEDFGYLREERSRFSGLLRKAALLGATLFSIFCFIYITISAYNFVYEDEMPIETIPSPTLPIKVTAETQVVDNDKNTNSSVYDDIFGNKKESLDKIIPKVYLAPEPVKPPKQKEVHVYSQQDLQKADEKKVEQKAGSQKILIYSDQKDEKEVKDLLTKGNVQKARRTEPARGRIKVQIAALTSENAVNAYWAKLNRTRADLFTDLKLYTKKVDLGKRGIFYRVQIGNFRDQIDADAFCEKYVAQENKSRADCILVE